MVKFNQPFDSYFGGKSGNGTYQNIINNIPYCDVFIDAMCGNCGISSNIKTDSIIVVNDIDCRVIDNINYVGLPDNIRIYNKNYMDLLDGFDYTAEKKYVVYFDPPYIKSSRRSGKNVYAFEWDDEQHIQFLEYVSKLSFDVMISHYPNQLYDKALQDWRVHDFYSKTRVGMAHERIYMNFNAPTMLLDYSYIGNDFIDRQRIKRKINSLHRKFSSMTAVEQSYFLHLVNH